MKTVLLALRFLRRILSVRDYARLIALLFILGFHWIQAQVIETEPLLALALPMEEKENRVVLTQAILINKDIIPLGATLRVLYVMPQIGDNEVRNEIIKKQQENSYSRVPTKYTKEESALVIASKKLALETRWTTTQLFKLKLANQNTSDLRLVYQENSESQIQEVPLNFLHGLFLGEKSGKVTVLAVEKGSPAAYGSFIKGDGIIQIGSQKLEGTLSQFLTVYHEEKTKAEASPSRELLFQLLPEKQESPVTRSIKVALSLKSNLLDY